MQKKFTNQEIAELLRNIAAAYTLTGKNRFEIIAYENAADSVEHATDEVQQIWADDGKIELPGIGKGIGGYLGELFEKGRSKHFDETLSKYPKEIYSLLKIPGVGPKTALKLVELGVRDLDDLELKLERGYLNSRGFSEKIAEKIREGLAEIKKRGNRMLLSKAKEISDELIDYLKKQPEVKQAYALGSLRRKVATVGDIDLGVASTDAKKTVNYFLAFKGSRKIESGEKSATIALHNGLRVDLLVESEDNFGNLLQHFTGAAAHNVHFRQLAKDKSYIVSEYGIRKEEDRTNKKGLSLIKFKTEKEVYNFFGMDYIEPELREDTGEIEAALKKELPQTINLEDIRGDLHTHSFYSDGNDSVVDMAKTAFAKGYEYIVLTDHSYPNLNYEKRLKEIEEFNRSKPKIHLIPGLEVNITVDAKLQVKDEILKMHSWNTASIHTGFNQSREEITARYLYALEHPYIEVISHPTGRLINQRNGVNANWEKIFETAIKNDKFIEIDAYPNRMDLPDNLIREAVKAGVKFVINSDAHATNQLDVMEYGIYLAKRGWVTPDMVLNTLPWEKFKNFLR